MSALTKSWSLFHANRVASLLRPNASLCSIFGQYASTTSQSSDSSSSLNSSRRSKASFDSDRVRSRESEQEKSETERQVQAFDAFREKTYASMSPKEKVVEGTKDTFSIAVILAGVALTGFVGYIIFKELFSKDTPNGIYSQALRLCKNSEELRASIGTSINGFGEDTGRGRRRHVSHAKLLIDNVPCIRMQFYVKGPNGSGTVRLEVRKLPSAKHFEFRYLLVELDGSHRRPIIIIDNR